MTTAQTLLQSDQLVGTWTLDPSRTRVQIAHKTFWGLMNVKGHFGEVSGSGAIAADHTVSGSVSLGAASLDTKNAKRDKHLHGPDFFDAEKHANLVVTVHSAAVDGTQLALSGELTIKDVREPVTLKAEVTELDPDTLAVHVTGSVDRHRFGLSFNQLGMIKGLTSLDIDAVFTRATA